MMRAAHVDAMVRLKVDVPTLHLQRGEEGVVVSIWFSPGHSLYEVEFPKSGAPAPLRTLLRIGQLEFVESMHQRAGKAG